jgi:sugar phosphate permease
VLPLGGMAGAVFAGFASDRWFAGRRVPVLVGFLLALGALALAYGATVESHPGLAVALLAFIGSASTAAGAAGRGGRDGHRAGAGRAVAAVGFVNLFGYLGAFAGDKVTGELADTTAGRRPSASGPCARSAPPSSSCRSGASRQPRNP